MKQTKKMLRSRVHSPLGRMWNTVTKSLGHVDFNLAIYHRERVTAGLQQSLKENKHGQNVQVDSNL